MAGFVDYFVQNMNSLGVPAPSSIFTSVTTVAAAATVLSTAVEKYGTNITIYELMKCGLLSEKFAIVGTLSAAGYLGAILGSTAVALGKTLSGGTSIADVVWDITHPDEINPTTNDTYNQSRNFVQRSDPLVLDLDGDGIETIGIGSTPVLFDFDGDGSRTGTGWLKGDDAFVVLDRNGNGVIDNGSELFGVDTVLKNGQKASSGFEAKRCSASCA